MLPKSQMHLHDYIIISQNKQDNSILCTILNYHLVCSDHDERVTKIGSAMRITELEAKSKGSVAPQASSSSVESGDYPSPTTYW